MAQTEQTQVSGVWGTFVGNINQEALHRIFKLLSAVTGGASHIHLLFQSSGGTVGDGIALYNYFRTLPVGLSLYNVGSVASIAAVAFLGAPNRFASTYSTFMIHRSQLSPQLANAAQMRALSEMIGIDDERTEQILRHHLVMSDDQWTVHRAADLWFTSADAVECRLATGIAEFVPPPGTALFNV